MNTITVIKNNKTFTCVEASIILDKLSPSDKPYYIIIEEDSIFYTLRCSYIYDKEEKTTISIGNTHLIFGNISGKIYRYTTEQHNVISPSKFKEKVKELDSYKNDSRFKTNVSSLINLLNEVITKK